MDCAKWSLKEKLLGDGQEFFLRLGQQKAKEIFRVGHEICRVLEICPSDLEIAEGPGWCDFVNRTAAVLPSHQRKI